MITGVRVNKFSVHEKYKIKPDITTVGKIVGGGLPIGVIGISKKVENKIKNNEIKVFFGGTFSANSLSCYVGNRTLNYLFNNRIIFNKLNNNSKYFQKKINTFIEKNNIDAKVFRFDSILRLVFSKKKIDNRIQRDFFEKIKIEKIKKFRKFLLNKKIYYPTNGIIFLSYASGKKNLDHVINNFLIGLKKFF